MTKSTVALPSFIALLAVVSVETSVAFSAHDSNNNFGIVDYPSHHALKFTIQPHSLHHQGRLSNTINRSMTQTKLYRKFHDYGWDKLMPDGDVAEIDTVPEELRYNTSPAKGAPPGTNVVANIRSISQFPFLNAENKGTDDSDRNQVVLRLARSACSCTSAKLRNLPRAGFAAFQAALSVTAQSFGASYRWHTIRLSLLAFASSSQIENRSLSFGAWVLIAISNGLE